MNSKHLLIVIGTVLFIWACAGKPEPTPEPIPLEAEDELFANAEKLFETQSYGEALDLYETYFRRFPDKPLAPAALMKIGLIHALAGDYEKARTAYREILAQYPSSPFAPDAAVEELHAYYQEGRYEDVLNRAPDLLEEIYSRSHVFRIYTLLADTLMASGSPIDAMEYYARAQQMATELEQETIAAKLKEAIDQLDSDEVAVLLDRPDLNLPMDYLLYQLGLRYAQEEKYDDALKILAEFINRYPQHENRALVDSLLENIKNNAVFNRSTIGCLLPLSGPYQTFGQRALKGIELALDQFSSQSGNPPINIIVKDSGADTHQTMVAMQELFQDQVAAILGPIVTVEVAAQESQKMGIPIMTITQKDDISQIGDNVFRNFITPRMQVQALASYAVESLGLRRFAVLYPDENYGHTFMNLFWDELLESGGKVVGVASYSPDLTDFTDPIKKLVGLFYEIPPDLKPQNEVSTTGADPETSGQGDNTQGNSEKDIEDEEPEPIVDFDAIFIPDSPKKAGMIVPQLAYNDVKDVYLFGTNLWHSDALIKTADQYVQGAIMPDGFFAESSATPVQDFVKAFEETYQEKPDFIEAVVYDSAMILFDVISRPNIRFRSDIRDALLDSEGFPGVTGLTRFDETGDVQRKLHILQVKGTGFVELE
jgi:ABC-type branched-subunit amino acid transport system substrate-binding protein